MAQRTCSACGETLPPNCRADRQYCSRKCTRRSQPPCLEAGCERPLVARGLCSGHWKAAYGGPRAVEPVPCGYCGVICIKHKTSARSVRYCSYACRDWARSDRVLSMPVPDMHPSRSSPVPRDHPSRAHEMLRGQSSRVFVSDCQVCESPFVSRTTTVTCSPKCAERKRLDDAHEHKSRRRARKRDAFVAPVYRQKVYERDGWRCHLCRKKVDKGRAVPHPKAPVIDHVVPLAAGGTHEPANCRTAHYLCNTIKGARGGGEQLWLIG